MSNGSFKRVYLLNLRRKKSFIEGMVKFYNEALIDVNKKIAEVEND